MATAIQVFCCKLVVWVLLADWLRQACTSCYGCLVVPPCDDIAE